MASKKEGPFLHCNNSLCGAKLDRGDAWVTFCSHIFCAPCGTVLKTDLVCMACGMSLEGNWRLHSMNLQPSDQWRKMVLAGLSPRLVMEICSEALMFHQHQQQLEIDYLGQRLQRSSGKIEVVKDYYSKVIKEMQQRISELEKTIAAKHTGYGSNLQPMLKNLPMGQHLGRDNSEMARHDQGPGPSLPQLGYNRTQPGSILDQNGHNIAQLGHNRGTPKFSLVRAEVLREDRVTSNMGGTQILNISRKRGAVTPQFELLPDLLKKVVSRGPGGLRQVRSLPGLQSPSPSPNSTNHSTPNTGPYF